MKKYLYLVITSIFLIAGLFVLKYYTSSKNTALGRDVVSKAVKVANENGFIAKDLEVEESSMLTNTETPNRLNNVSTLRIKSCSLNKTMHLDPKTFKVLKFEDEVWCGGVLGK